MVTYTIERKVSVTKEEYAKHLEEQIQYWTNRLARHETEAEEKIRRYIQKQELRATEIQAIILNKKAELKGLK